MRGRQIAFALVADSRLRLRRSRTAADGFAKQLVVKSVDAPKQKSFPHHAVSHVRLRAGADRVFAHLNDHARLAAHMSRRSWRMGWGRMNLHLDDQAGRAVGSRIRLDGRVLGFKLSLDEAVTEYTPPTRKVWATVGTPRLLVIGAYRMGLTLVSAGSDGVDAVTLCVFIDYALPERGLSLLLGRIFGHWYAQWCTERMSSDARAAFAIASPTSAV